MLIGVAVEPLVEESGHYFCPICDYAVFGSLHDYTIHQLSDGHQYWLNHGWAR